MSKAVDPKSRTISISGLAEVEQLARAGKTTEHGIYQPHSCWWEVITNNGDGTYEVQRVLATWSDTSVATDDRYDVRNGMDIDGLATIAEGRYVWGRLHATKDGELVVLFRGHVATLLMEITGDAEIDAAKTGPGDPATATEWTYSAKEVTETVASDELSYTDVTDGVTLTNKLLNRCEKDNRDVVSGGTFGNGVAYDELDDDISTGWLEPVPTGLVVRVDLITIDDGAGGTETWGIFSMPNAVGTECD